MTTEEFNKLVDAIMVLNKHFGGTEWKLELSAVSYFDPSNFKSFKPIIVNGVQCGALDVEVTQDKEVFGDV